MQWELPKNVEVDGTEYEIRNDCDYRVKQLYRIQNSVFKDIHRKLVSSLIRFFEELQQKKHGGDVYVKISFFDKIRQRGRQTVCFRLKILL